METSPLFEEPKAPPLVLRDYQQEAVNKIIWDLKQDGNSLCVVATGGGKSIIIAETVRAYTHDTLILQPTKEILEQNYEKLLRYVPKEQIGIYSASMGEKRVSDYTFATIQSIYNDPEFFAHFGLIIIDEAHILNPKSMTGMFMSFIKKVNAIRKQSGLETVKVIGFTATPYRLDTMYVDWGTADARRVTTVKLINRMKGFFWSRILINITMDLLIQKGYLCAPVYIDASVVEQSEVPLNKSRSEFDMDMFDRILESKMDKLKRAVEYGERTSKSVLVFCSSVSQATRMADQTPGSEVVTGKTPKKERDRIITAFKEHEVKTVFNVGVLTTGFDHPGLDCIILMRPTRSIMLYVQMVGRGVRIAEGKVACKVIDLTSNVKNLGRVETIKIHKPDGEPWDLISETGSWHAKELYSFGVNKWADVPKLPPPEEIDYSKPPF